MSNITTPYQKRSYTSIKAAAEKDRDGTTKKQCSALIALMQERGALGVCIFEAADYLADKFKCEVAPGTASGRMSDLMSDEKCQRYFGCPALAQKGKQRRVNPHSDKTGQAYILKSFADGTTTPRGGTSVEAAGSGIGVSTSTPRDPAAAPCDTGNPHEGPDAYRTEMLEGAAGRRVAAEYRAGMKPAQLDFGFGNQLRHVR